MARLLGPANTLSHIGIVISLLGLFAGSLVWEPFELFSFGISASVLFAVGLVLILLGTKFRIGSRRASLFLLLLLALVVAAAARSRTTTSFLEGISDGKIFACLITALFLRPIFIRWPRTVAAGVCLLLGLLFLYSASGRLLFGDDHPTFLFRLMMLKEGFPYIPAYTPLWNAGIEFRDVFASGALAIFLLFSPLIYAFDLNSIYNVLVTLLLFGLTPLSLAWSLRLLGRPSTEQAIAAILAITTSKLWFAWALAYGTLGFILAIALLPLVAALFIRLLEDQQTWNRTLFWLGLVSVSLLLLWPISTIAIAPLALVALRHWRKLLQQQTLRRLGIALLFVNLPWMLIFAQASGVSQFLQREKSSATVLSSLMDSPVSVKKSSENIDVKARTTGLRKIVAAVNPLLLTFMLSAWFFLPGRNSNLLLTEFLWLLGVSLLGPLYKPQLELDRFFLFALMFSVVPCAIALAAIPTHFSGATTFKRRTIETLLIGLLLLGVLSSMCTVLQRTKLSINFTDDRIAELSREIAASSHGARVIIAGFTLHELTGGHVAPLPFFANTPMIARSYKHDSWDYHDVLPEEYRRDKGARIEEFFDLYNVKAIVVHDRFWRNYFQKKPAEYRLRWKVPGFVIFERTKTPPGYFLEGSGEVLRQNSHEVVVRVDSKDSILRFHYFPFLEADHCALSAKEVANGVQFVSLQNCPSGAIVRIRAASPWSRWFPSLK